MNSIATRLLLSASLVLGGFVLLTYFSVRHSVYQQAEQALHDRMQGLIYGILGAAELDTDNQLVVNEYELPDQRLLSPVPGTYAEIRDSQRQRIWSSHSTVAYIPPVTAVAVGQWKFINAPAQSGNSNDARESSSSVRALQFATSWILDDDREQLFYLQVVNDADDFERQLSEFDRNLWITLSLSALALLLVQLLVLTWGLNPLAKLGRNLSRIERGEAEALDTQLPVELKPLATSVNTLLQSERNRHLRYRNVVDDLAHSLKTPLSVLNNIGDSVSDRENASLMQTQTRRMGDIIAYHMRRANAGSAMALAPPVAIRPVLERLRSPLTKVYRDRDISFEFTIEEHVEARITAADLMEVMGNVLENACKYGATVIRVSAQTQDGKLAASAIVIEDNGPGFPPGQRKSLTERGRRADTQQEGQGLGLAVTRELLESYGGELVLAQSPALGGAMVILGLAQLSTRQDVP